MNSERGRPLALWLAALIVACVLPLVAMAAWLAYQGVGQQQAERERVAADWAQNVASAIDQDLRAHIGALQMLAHSPLLADPSRWGELHREAQGFHVGFGSHVILVGGEPLHMLLNTRVAYGTALPPLPRPQGRDAVPLALQTGEAVVGDLFQGPIAGAALVAIAVPVPRPRAGAAPLVLLSTPEARLFQQRLEQLAVPTEWVVSLLDGRGEPIARHAPPGRAAAAADGAAARYRVGLQGAPWTVELEIASAIVQRPLRQAGIALGLAVAAAALLAVGGGLVTAQRLRRAVESLTQASPAAGDYAIAEINRVRRRLDAAARHRDVALELERAARAQARATFALANVGIAHVDPDGRWLRVNRKLCEIVGHEEDELLHLTFQDITHADDLAADLDRVRQLLAGEITSYELDKRYRRKDGSEVWVTLAVALVRDELTQPEYFICVLVDIGERKRLERRNREQVEALRASESYRRRIFEQMTDGVLLLGLQGRIHDANPRAAAMFGVGRDELLQLGLSDVLTEADQQRVPDEVQQVMAGHATLTEWAPLRRDGSSFSVEVSAGRLDARRYLVVLRDISPRKAAEQALLGYQAELSELAQRLMAQERTTTRRVAQALHDRLGQTLAVARLRLGAMSLCSPGGTPLAQDKDLAALGELLAQAVAETRLVLTELRPPLLEDQGLAAALDNEVRRLHLNAGEAIQPQLEVTAQASAQRWPADIEYAAFMVAREALANALAHAQAGSINLRLDGDAMTLQMEIADDGIGIAPELAGGRPGHLGIVGMRERALAVGARFVVSGPAGSGARVGFTWSRGLA